MSPRVLLLVLLWTSGTTYADAPALTRLAPSASAVHAERTRELELRLSRMLAGWPEVERAEVLLARPLVSEQPLDQPLPRTTASVVLTRVASAAASPLAHPTRDEVFQLLHAALPTLAAEDLTLLGHAAAKVSADTRLVRVGPWEVSEETAPKLRLTAGISLAIHALLAGIVLWRLRPNRPAARKVDPRARTPFPP